MSDTCTLYGIMSSFSREYHALDSLYHLSRIDSGYTERQSVLSRPGACRDDIVAWRTLGSRRQYSRLVTTADMVSHSMRCQQYLWHIRVGLCKAEHARFRAYQWHVQKVDDGNDLKAIQEAIKAARAETGKPSLIALRTHIAYGSPNKQDSHDAHGAPLGEDEVRLTKENLGWPADKTFHVPDRALKLFRKSLEKGRKAEAAWKKRAAAYARKYPQLAKEWEAAATGKPSRGWDAKVPTFANGKPIATRAA